MRSFIKLSAVILILVSAQIILAQTTEFTYQGKLTDSGTPSATYDFEFRLFNAATGGAALATQQKAAVPVSNNVFNVTLDFGEAVFDGTDRWLEIAVKHSVDANYTTLSPRQKISSIPYSVKSKTAETANDSTKLGGVAASEYVTQSNLSTNFIRNQTTQQANSNFNVSGNGVIGTLLGVGKSTTPGVRIDSQGTIRSIDSISTSIISETSGGTNAWARFYMITPSQRWFIGSSQNFNGNQLYLFDETGGQSRMTIQPNGGDIAFPFGSVGVGTTAPSSKLDVRGNLTLESGSSPVLYTSTAGTEQNRFLQLINSSNSPSASGLKAGGILVADQFGFANPGKNDLVVKGNVGIGVSNPTQKLEVDGTTKTNILQITGGSDLAENFEIADKDIKPGMIVAIDPNNAGKLVLARGAYNRQVAGVISGANNLSAGMVLPDLKPNGSSLPVALSGRVWVYVDASKNTVKPGDLLTTSDAPGYAMKVTNHKKANGAIIGKAMTELKSGTGLVLVLVSLQ